MVFKDSLSELFVAYVRVDERGVYLLVPEHSLNGAQVGAPLKQSRGKRVAEGVGRDCLLYARLLSLPFNHYENHRAREVRPASVKKHIIVLARFNLHQVTVEEPTLKVGDSLIAHRHQTFLVALAANEQHPVLQIQVAELHVHQFTNAQTARKQHLNDGAVACSLSLGEVNGVFYAVNLLKGEHHRQMFRQRGPLQQFCRVALHHPIEHEEPEERAHATEHASL